MNEAFKNFLQATNIDEQLKLTFAKIFSALSPTAGVELSEKVNTILDESNVIEKFFTEKFTDDELNEIAEKLSSPVMQRYFKQTETFGEELTKLIEEKLLSV